MPRRFTRRTFLKSAMAAPGVAALSRKTGAQQVEPDRAKNVVLVMVDQLRKDAADRWCTKVDTLARQGIKFELARAAAPWTYPSVVSMMSGLFPQQHGADGHPIRPDILSTFSDDVPLLPAILREMGYRTSGFVTNPFFHTWNPFHKNFDHYDVSFIRNQANRRGYRGRFWTTERMFANTVNSAIREHFDGFPADAPEFTYVHYIDVHGPWESAPFEGEYEPACKYVDEKIVELYEYFLSRYSGNLIFIVISDHGRVLGDDVDIGEGPPERIQKGSVHDFNLRIVFNILPSDVVQAPRVIFDACSNVDVTPTLLDWLDIPLPYPTPGMSLKSIMDGTDEKPASRPIYAKVSAFNRGSDCVVFENKKYYRAMDMETGRVTSKHVFDLLHDPRETVSIADDFGTMEGVFEQMAGRHSIQFSTSYDEELPDDVRESLEALGYLN